MPRLVVCLLFLVASLAPAAEDPAAPRVAIFPLAGDAPQELRDRAGFSLRQKLDRTKKYDVIDAPKMLDVAAESDAPIAFATVADSVTKLNRFVEADILIWGEIARTAGRDELRLKILDLREKDAKPRQIKEPLATPTDLRFATERILETMPGVAPFQHVPEEGDIRIDPEADELWKKNPNLVFNPGFDEPKGWMAIYQAEKYRLPISAKPPAIDKVAIYRLAEAGKTNNVLAMNPSRYCAENNGMACLSDSIEIAPGARYRLSFRYKSDGPTLHVFVKGYTWDRNIKDERVEREIYRRQVPPTGHTKGQWVTIVDELNPQHRALPVQTLRVDLYAYLHPGSVMFDDITLKLVGQQNRKAEDEALDKPLARPKR